MSFVPQAGAIVDGPMYPIPEPPTATHHTPTEIGPYMMAPLTPPSHEAVVEDQPNYAEIEAISQLATLDDEQQTAEVDDEYFYAELD
jgi:hypothetical protein